MGRNSLLCTFSCSLGLNYYHYHYYFIYKFLYLLMQQSLVKTGVEIFLPTFVDIRSSSGSCERASTLIRRTPWSELPNGSWHKLIARQMNMHEFIYYYLRLARSCELTCEIHFAILNKSTRKQVLVEKRFLPRKFFVYLSFAGPP